MARQRSREGGVLLVPDCATVLPERPRHSPRTKPIARVRLYVIAVSRKSQGDYKGGFVAGRRIKKPHAGPEGLAAAWGERNKSSSSQLTRTRHGTIRDMKRASDPER
jgi:hypothetical protein